MTPQSNAEVMTITKEEYAKLKSLEKVDTGLIEEIAQGIKDIVAGKIKEV